MITLPHLKIISNNFGVLYSRCGGGSVYLSESIFHNIPVFEKMKRKEGGSYGCLSLFPIRLKFYM